MLPPEHEKLHQLALEKASLYRKVEAELLEILDQMDTQKIYRALGYASLFDYSTKALKLTEASAFNFITVARKAREIPELKAEIQAGNLSVSKARKITPILHSENKGEWLQKAKTLSQRELEKEVAKVSPKTAVPERAVYVSDKRMKLTLGISEELMKRLKRAQDLVSSSQRKAVSYEETLEEALNLFLQRKDPVEKSKQAEVKEKSRPPSVPSQTTSSRSLSRDRFSRNRKHLPAAVSHKVFGRDQGKCQHQNPDGTLCQKARWVHLHHLQPIAMGGPNTLANLTTLCANHHRLVHERASPRFSRR